jgi:hypothetical protein
MMFFTLSSEELIYFDLSLSDDAIVMAAADVTIVTWMVSPGNPQICQKSIAKLIAVRTSVWHPLATKAFSIQDCSC